MTAKGVTPLSVLTERVISEPRNELFGNLPLIAKSRYAPKISESLGVLPNSLAQDLLSVYRDLASILLKSRKMRFDNNDILLSVQRMYDEAGEYFSKTRSKKYGESANWPVTQKYLDELKRGESVLDVGCGNGRLVSGLPPGVKYYGFDFSRTLLEEANERYPNNSFGYGDVTDPSVWKKLSKFNAIFCVAVLHHIPTREQQLFVVKQMKIHAKRNALLFLSVWNLWQSTFLQNHLDSYELKKIDEKYVKVPFMKKWERFCVAIDLPYLVGLLQEAGWETENVFYADRDGNESGVVEGQNLVAVARGK